ncbi:hypothetical protein [Mycolicibacterium austroafricanum]|uniref:hypothetical protein n=1 Tax=Mycolicibacterium austroafricanum TaxID=39687 RepID=UPI001CA33125|nr:hypothetical protein [Mycolicibacterium austroafricanum]QZT61245.1 hypothetical protein JN085_19960 [Mycolicibacterium austroafricanum]
MTRAVPKPAVATARSIIAAALPGTTVRDRIPAPRPKKFVVIKRAGGTQTLAEDVARIVVDCYAEDSADAEDLAAEAMTAMWNAETTTGVDYAYWSDGTGPYDQPNPDVTDRYRWQFNGLLHISLR